MITVTVNLNKHLNIKYLIPFSRILGNESMECHNFNVETMKSVNNDKINDIKARLETANRSKFVNLMNSIKNLII